MRPRSSDHVFRWISPRLRMQGLADHINWCRKQYVEYGGTGAKRIFLQEMTNTLIDLDRVGVQLAASLKKKAEHDAVMFDYMAEFTNGNLGPLFKRPFSVAKFNGI